MGGRSPRRGLLVLASLALCSCGPSPPRSVLLISIDSLRADHLGCYGHVRDTSPTLDRLAAGGVRFERAQSPTSWTLPSHVTLLSGREQLRHGVIDDHDRIAPDEVLLQQVFQDHGYETVGLFSGPFLDPVFGFERGFDAYVSCRSPGARNRPALQTQVLAYDDETNPRIRDAFAAWLERRSERPFFAFVHMWDVHFDYIPPPAHATRFDPDYDGPLDGTRIVGRGFPLDASPRDVEHLEALYDGEIRYVDETIAALLAMLLGEDLLDHTLVVVTADHGEEFLEHGGKTHRRTLFEESIRVPLVFAGALPGRARAVATPVGLEDVAPTILDLVGLSGLPDADGRSLAPLLRGDRLPPRDLFSALYERGEPSLAALRRGAIKVIRDFDADTWSQYDLEADPGEREPGPVDPALERRLRERLSAVAGALAGRPRSKPLQPLPAELVEELRRLGYLE